MSKNNFDLAQLTLPSPNCHCCSFLSQAKIDLAKGVDITYRTAGGVFKLNHFGAKSKVKTVGLTIVDLQYMDDCSCCSLSTRSPEHI